ncbi:hypothetical protein [Ammoniphilus sp. 3BR4]|uniref:hypothetical protein n=1 Tax=Ammoniphilus sp. 3BR4 TaxID=3158265 RepID=UPI003465A0BE
MKDDVYDRLMKKIDDKVPRFPFYVQEFIQHKLGKFSPQTIHEYLYDYRTFFEWLLTKHEYQTIQ